MMELKLKILKINRMKVLRDEKSFMNYSYSLEKAVIVPISDRKGKPLEDYEVTKKVIKHDIEMEKTRQKFHINDEGNKS
jgi:hypothetical protein